MYKTRKTRMKLDKRELRLLRLVSHIAKNIYNVSLYHLRQAYFNQKRVLSYQELKALVKENINYRMLDPYQSACIMNALIRAMKLHTYYHNTDGSLKEKFKNNELAKSYSLPKYKKKNAYQTIEFGNMEIINEKRKTITKLPLAYKLKNGYIFKEKYNDELLNKFIKQSHLSTNQELELFINRSLYKKTIKQIKIVPKENGEAFEIQFLYLDAKKEVIDTDKTEDLAIDLGVSNLATCITTNNKSFIIDGKMLKSIIRLYSKKIALARSNLPFIPKTNKERQLYFSKYISNLYLRLNARIENYINNAVKKLIDNALENKVKRIIIGWNNDFKRYGIKSDYSKKTIAKANQSFIRIPHSVFKEKLKHKANEYGINVVEIDEAYTSKASFYDNDSLEQRTFSGTRITRGLYITKTGQIVNADVNAALNIYKKYITKGSSNKNKLEFLMSSGVLVPNRIRVL